MDVGAWADGVGSWLAGQWPAARALWVRQAGWMAGLGVAFALLTRLTPCNRGMGWWPSPYLLRSGLSADTGIARVGFLAVLLLVQHGGRIEQRQVG